MSQEVADLYIRLRSNAAELVPQFEAAGDTAERMAAKITASSAAILREQREMLASMGALTTKADEMALQFGIDYQKMTADCIRLTTAMEAQTAKAAASVNAMAAEIDSAAARSTATTQGKVNQVKQIAGAVSLVGGLVAYETVKMAGDFEASTNRLVTSAGETHANLEMVRDGILDMAATVGYSAEDLSRALYTIESGGQHGADGLKVLQAAAEGAKAENADLELVADAVTSVMVDYHLKADDAAMVTTKLVAATSVGKATFQELTGAMSAVLPVASAAHVSLDDILGSLAAMTVHGMSARQAAQNLTDVIRHMQAPTAVQTKELAALGINSQDLADKLGESGLSGTLQMIANRIKDSMGGEAKKVILDLENALRGLPPAVQDLGRQVLNGSISLKQFSADTKELDPIAAAQARSFATLAGSMHQIGNTQIDGAHVMQSYGQALAKATGDATGLNVALMLTGENADGTNERIKAVADATTEAGNHVKGWADIQGTFNQKVSEAKAGVGSLSISIGMVLLPVASRIAEVIADVTGWLSRNQAAAGILAAVIVGSLIVAFSALLAVFWGFAANPVTWIIAGIIAAVLLLAAGVYMLISHWQQVAGFFVGIWNTIKAAFSTAVGWIGDRITDLVNWFKNLPGNILAGLASLGSMLANLARNAWNGFLNFTRSAITNTLNFIRNLPYMIGYALGFLAGLLARLAVNAWDAFTGGLKTAWNATVAFFHNLPGWIAGFFASAGNWLVTKGWDLLVGFWNGIVNAWNWTVDFFTQLPARILLFLAGIDHWIKQKGHELLVGLWNGIVDGWNWTVDFFKNLPGNVLSFFANAGSWLLDVGKHLLEGLWAGIKNAAGWLWDQITSFAQGIIDGFKEAFGINSPSRYTREHGQGLVEGLMLGIDDLTHNAVGSAQQLATRVTGAMSGMTATATLGLSASDMPELAGMVAPLSLVSGGIQTGIGGAAGGGVQVINVTVPVNGTVIAERDLQKSIQQVVLQYAGRNSGPGWTPAFS